MYWVITVASWNTTYPLLMCMVHMSTCIHMYCDTRNMLYIQVNRPTIQVNIIRRLYGQTVWLEACGRLAGERVYVWVYWVQASVVLCTIQSVISPILFLSNWQPVCVCVSSGLHVCEVFTCNSFITIAHFG